jgi:predicted  nucleic acid-binding Zn-ribbon protein
MKWNGKVWTEEFQGEKDRGIIIGYITPEMVCKCLRCGVKFLPKQGRLPKACPACTTILWKQPVKNKLLSDQQKNRWMEKIPDTPQFKIKGIDENHLAQRDFIKYQERQAKKADDRFIKGNDFYLYQYAQRHINLTRKKEAGK